MQKQKQELMNLQLQRMDKQLEKNSMDVAGRLEEIDNLKEESLKLKEQVKSKADEEQKLQ